MIGMEQNRRRRTTDRRLAKRIDRHLAFLKKELTEIDGDIDAGVALRRLGARLSSFSPQCQASGRLQREHSSQNCRNLDSSIAANSPRSWGLRRSTAKLRNLARPSHDQLADEQASVPRFTWPPSSPSVSTR